MVKINLQKRGKNLKEITQKEFPAGSTYMLNVFIWTFWYEIVPHAVKMYYDPQCLSFLSRTKCSDMQPSPNNGAKPEPNDIKG